MSATRSLPSSDIPPLLQVINSLAILSTCFSSGQPLDQLIVNLIRIVVFADIFEHIYVCGCCYSARLLARLASLVGC